MLPFLVLIISVLVLRIIGATGVIALQSWTHSLRGGFAVMFLLTASAHWGIRRPDLVRMVPKIFPRPDLIVTITGILEIAGAIGLLVPSTTKVASTCLAFMLIAMFPANVRAARENLTLGGKPATPLVLRTFLQIAFIAALMWAGWSK
jgi:uncharacterized membrane protein